MSIRKEDIDKLKKNGLIDNETYKELEERLKEKVEKKEKQINATLDKYKDCNLTLFFPKA